MIRKSSGLTHVTALLKANYCNVFNLFTQCVYVYICVCVCVCISFQRKSFSWMNKTIKFNARDQVSDGMLQKYICIKYLYLRVKENHKKNLQAGNCAKECQLNWENRRKVKNNSYKLSKEQTIKKRQYIFLHTH